MDTEWQPTQGSDPAKAGGIAVAVGINQNTPARGGEWRGELLPESRRRIIDKMYAGSTRFSALPVTTTPQAVLNNLPRVSARVEEKIYNLATDLPDYLWKISLKMLHVGNTAQRHRERAPVIRNANNPGPAPAALPPQGGNQPQPPAIPLMPRRQAQQQNIYAYAQAPSLANTRQTFPGVNQPHMLQNVPGMPQNTTNNGLNTTNNGLNTMNNGLNTMNNGLNTMNNGLPQVAPQNIYAPQGQIAGGQQQQPHNQLIYQQQQMLIGQNLQQQGSVIQPHIQQRQFVQAPRRLRQVPFGASVNATSRAGLPGVNDWREEIYQMIKSLKDQHFAELSELYNKVSAMAHRVDAINKPPQQNYERMKRLKLLLERIFNIMHMNKANIQPAMRNGIHLLEKRIWHILSTYRRRRVVGGL